MPLQPNSTILNGKYHIERLLDEGGMARVWLAKQPFSGRMVAIKEPKLEALKPEEVGKIEKRFKQELALIAQLLSIPHVVQVYTDELLEDGTRLLVMEYVEGGSLADLIEKNQSGLPIEQVIAIASQICDALQRFHRLPISPVHRDIAPRNILLTTQGDAKLSDFGVAQLPGYTEGRTVAAAEPHPGTPLYAAPEQLTSPGLLSRAADLYSLGAVLFEAVTGRPYKRQSPGTRASSLRAEVPAALDEALATALAERPEDRFQSAQEFAQALTEEPPPRRWLVPAILIGLLLVMASIWMAARPGSTPKPTQTVAVLTLTLTASPTTPTKITPTKTISPTQTTLTLVPILPVLALTPIPQPVETIAVENVSRIVPLARWGQGVANWVAYAPDGRIMAVASSLGVYLYDVRTRTPIRFIETEYPVNGLTFSPDSSEVVTWSASVTDVGRWRLSDGSLIQQMTRLSGSVQFAYTPDGSLVQLVQTGDNRLLIQNLGTGKELWSLSYSTGAFTVSPDGQVIATTRCHDALRPVDCEKLIAIWRSTNRQQIDSIVPALDAAIVGLRFAPDRRFLAVWLNDGTIKIWSLLDKVWLPNRFTGVSGVMNLTFSPNDSLVAFGTTAGGVYLWRVADGKVLLATLVGWPVNTVTFSPDGAQLAAATRDAVRIWDVTTLVLAMLEGFAAPSPLYAVSPAGDTIATVLTNTIVLRSLSDGSMVSTFHGHQGAITTLAFAPDGKSLASGSADDTVRLWNISSGATSFIVAHLADVQSVAFSPDGQRLGVVAADNAARIWRIGDGAMSSAFTNNGDRITAFAFAPGADRVALGSCSEHVTAPDRISHCLRGRLWLPALSADGEKADLLELKEPAHAGYVDILTFAPAGGLLATSSRAGGDVHIWQLGDKVSLLNQIAVTSTNYLAFSPDGQILASGSGGRAIQLWRMPDGKLLTTLVGHTDAVTRIAFTAHGQQIVSSSADGTIRLWGIPPFDPAAITPTVTATATPVISITPVIK